MAPQHVHAIPTHACPPHTSESECLRTLQDGSFYVWHASSFALVRSFLLPGAVQLRRMQQAFAASPDGELLVSAGLRMGVLLVYSLVSGEVCVCVYMCVLSQGWDILLVYSLVCVCVCVCVRFASGEMCRWCTAWWVVYVCVRVRTRVCVHSQGRACCWWRVVGEEVCASSGLSGEVCCGVRCLRGNARATL